MKKTANVIVCILLVLAVLSVFVACDKTAPPEQNQLALQLKSSISDFLASDSFASAKAAKTTQELLLLSYLRYVDADCYTQDDAQSFKDVLSLIDSVCDDGELSDALYDEEGCPLYKVVESAYGQYKDGWQSICDYLLSWSLTYCRLAQYNASAQIEDDFGHAYLDSVKNYLSAKDSSDDYVAVPFGFDKASCIVAICCNLGFDAKVVAPNSHAFLLSYYAKDVQGNYTKSSGFSNWIGFTGRPLVAGSVLRDEEAYDVAYEKTMQGLFPYEDNFDMNISIDDTVNLDRLCNFYGYEIKSDYGSTEDSRFGILYGYINAIDMTKYQKEVYHGAVCTGDGCEHHVDEQDGQVYDLVATWLSTLQKTDDGKYVLADCVDLAVAVAYLAYESGIQAPTPCGAYSSALPVISL